MKQNIFYLDLDLDFYLEYIKENWAFVILNAKFTVQNVDTSEVKCFPKDV